jgi:CheY-like chemotaxis protein
MSDDSAATPRLADDGRPGSSVLLVVDDEPIVRYIVTRLLDPDDWTVAQAADGIDALQYIQRRQGPMPDIVLTDLVMPRLSGHLVIEVLQEFRPELPVVAMSGYTRQDTAAFRWGCLDKPFGQDELRACLAQVVRESRRPRATAGGPGAPAAAGAAADREALQRAREAYARSADLVAAALELDRARQQREPGDGRR